jgi:hypothetical protein
MGFSGNFELTHPLAKRLYDYIQQHVPAWRTGARREVLLSTRMRPEGLKGSYAARREALDFLVDGGWVDPRYHSPK